MRDTFSAAGQFGRELCIMTDEGLGGWVRIVIKESLTNNLLSVTQSVYFEIRCLKIEFLKTLWLISRFFRTFGS